MVRHKNRQHNLGTAAKQVAMVWENVMDDIRGRKLTNDGWRSLQVWLGECFFANPITLLTNWTPHVHIRICQDLKRFGYILIRRTPFVPNQHSQSNKVPNDICLSRSRKLNKQWRNLSLLMPSFFVNGFIIAATVTGWHCQMLTILLPVINKWLKYNNYW